MMKNYIEAVISEQINRAVYLKSLIPYPTEYPEILSLADRCSRILDENVRHLKYLLQELANREEDDIRDIFRGLRSCTRYIETIEYFGIPALRYQTRETKFLNKLIFRIHREINVPLIPPSVACISTRHYFINSFTNVIFVPVGEPGFLLHLPDIFHEIGHQVLFNRENDLRLKEVNQGFLETINRITDHYRSLLTAKARETGPREELMAIENSHSQWKNYWISEFFSDLFACYTLGPAYAWSNFHLATKKSEDVYKFSPFFPQSHPSDDARMKMLLIGLNKLGFSDEATTLLSRWKKMPFVANIEPIVEYQYAYPHSLMDEVADLTLEGLKTGDFSIITSERLEQLGKDSTIRLLNEAWTVFWNDLGAFREWEERTIEELKSII